MLFHRKLLILALAVPALAVSSGCTNSRWLSRKDYSRLHDPFMDPTPAVAASGTSSSDGAGMARLGAPTAAANAAASGLDVTSDSQSPGVARLSGPKPIQRVSAISTSDSPAGAVAHATYPGSGPATATYPGGEPRTADLPPYGGKPSSAAQSGPTLADFMQTKSAPAATPAAAAANPFAAQASGTGSAAAPFGNSPSPATAASGGAPGISPFAEFAPGQAGTAAASGIGQNAPVSSQAREDFAAWVNEQQAQANRISAAIRPAAASASSSGSAMGSGSSTAAPVFDEPSRMEEPLIPQESGNAFPPSASAAPVNPSTAASPLPATSLRGGAADNPFAAFDQPSAGQPAATIGGDGLDAGFEMDSGWKPSHFTRP